MHLIWYGSIILQIALTALLFTKRQFRTYPAFTCFITFCCLENVTLFLLRYNREAYFYGYWSAEAMCVVLKLWLLIELFHSACQTETMERVAVRRFYLIQGFLLAVSVALALAFPHHHPSLLMTVIRTAETGASLMLVLGMAALLLIVYLEGMYSLRRTRGIAMGLLFYLPIKLLIVALKGSHGPDLIARIRWFEVGAYLGALLLWGMTFCRPEAVRVAVSVEALERKASEIEGFLP